MGARHGLRVRARRAPPRRGAPGRRDPVPGVDRDRRGGGRARRGGPCRGTIRARPADVAPGDGGLHERLLGAPPRRRSDADRRDPSAEGRARRRLSMPSELAVPPGNAWRSASEVARDRLPERPVAAVGLGSGLDAVTEAIDIETEIPYEELPGFPSPSVPGHAGRLAFGRLLG